MSLSEPQGADPIGHLRDQITTAAADGFASGWLANIFGVDALTALAAAGQGVDGFELGTAVVPTYPRHPITMAQQALTVQAALEGRLALGIGLSHQVVIEGMFGYSFDKPARHMREYLEVLVPLLREGTASFSGETVQANVSLSVSRQDPVPVLLAALAPQMLRLAGSVADGTVLWMTGPATIENHIVPSLSAAAESAGRPSPRVVCTLPVCVTADEAAARERAAKVFNVYGQLPSYRAMLDREGAATPGDVAIVGDSASVRHQIEHLGEVGVTDFVAASFGSGDDAVATHEVLQSLT
jgi:F420-dependent oxidoreductase-like protein